MNLDLQPGIYIPAKARPKRPAGIMLVECLMYLGLLTLVLGVASAVFYEGWESEKKLRRNTDEIALTMRAGERWRADVRAATGPLRVEQDSQQQVLRIPQPRGEVTYSFWQHEIWRLAPDQGQGFRLLERVKSSEMIADQRGPITAWRWEIELSSREHHRSLRPLFTFLAVPNSVVKPTTTAATP